MGASEVNSMCVFNLVDWLRTENIRNELSTVVRFFFFNKCPKLVFAMSVRAAIGFQYSFFHLPAIVPSIGEQWAAG